MIVWADGAVVAAADAPVVTADDHGLTVGDGVFEVIKVMAGEPFALTRHLRRMTRSARALGLAMPAEQTVRDAVAQVLRADPDTDPGRMRITLTGGRAPLGSGRSEAPPTLLVAYSAMDPVEASTAIVTVPWPRNERGVLAGVKSTSYAENVIALAEAHRRGASEAVFANLQGHLCEGTGTNVGYVVDGEARTPTLASGCLAGITRELLLEWAEVREVDEPVEVLSTAEEVFLLSTARDVQPVHRSDDRELTPGPVAARLQELFARNATKSTDP